MNYVHAPLTSAHASLISAPRGRFADPTDEMIKQEQLRGMRLKNNAMTAPYNISAPVAGTASQRPTATPSGGSSQQPQRTRFSSMTTPQDQLARLQLQKARDEYYDDQVVESTERFGKHSPNATWDPTNGGRWVRRYRPGEKEAEAMSRILPVQDYFKTLSDNRALENSQALDQSRTMNEIYKYREGRRTDMATKVDVVGGDDKKSKVDALSRQKDYMLDYLRGAANSNERGMPYDANYNPEWGISTDGGNGGGDRDEGVDNNENDAFSDEPETSTSYDILEV